MRAAPPGEAASSHGTSRRPCVLLPGRLRFELRDSRFQRRELLARSCEYLRLHVVLLAAHEVETRERACEHAAKVLFEVLRGIRLGELRETRAEVSENLFLHLDLLIVRPRHRTCVVRQSFLSAQR